MSLDNVLGVAGAAKDHYGLLVFGLILSDNFNGYCCYFIFKLDKKIQMDCLVRFVGNFNSSFRSNLY